MRPLVSLTSPWASPSCARASTSRPSSLVLRDPQPADSHLLRVLLGCGRLGEPAYRQGQFQVEGLVKRVFALRMIDGSIRHVEAEDRLVVDEPVDTRGSPVDSVRVESAAVARG